MSYRIAKQDGVFGALGTTEQECLAVGGKFQWDPAGNMCRLPRASLSWLMPAVISASAIGVMAILLYLEKPKKLITNKRAKRNKLDPEQQKKFDELHARYHEKRAFAYSYCPTCKEEEKHQVLPKQYGEQQKLLCLECGRAHRETSDYEPPQRPWDFGLSSLPKSAPGKFGISASERRGQKFRTEAVLGKGVVAKLVGEIPRDMSKSEFLSLYTIRNLSEKDREAAWKQFKLRKVDR